jgi:hypothetical protein
MQSEQEPIMSLDAFDRYVRQSMVVDLEQFIEAPALPEYEREYNLTVVREQSKAEILAAISESEETDPEVAYRDAMALAHDENVSEWGAAIALGLDEWDDESVPFLELHRSIEMPLVQVWLGLLLNGFKIEQRGEFYETEQVWVLREMLYNPIDLTGICGFDRDSVDPTDLILIKTVKYNTCWRSIFVP